MLRKSAVGRLFDQRFGPALLFDFSEGGMSDLVGGVPLTFARSTTATAVVNGVLTNFGTNVPRIIPSVPGVTNYTTFSEDLTNPVWVKWNSATGTTAQRLVANAGTAFHYVRRDYPTVVPSLDVGEPIAYSTRLKYVNNPWVFITFPSDNNVSYFNTQTGAWGSVHASVTGYSAALQADGSYILKMTSTAQSGGSPGYGVGTANSTGTSGNVGATGTEAVDVLWQQFECRVAAAGSYVPSLGSTVANRGQLLGLLLEPAMTNKCLNYNAVPNGSLTNLTKSGDAAATLTEVADSAALAAAGLSGICTGNVFKLDNSAGVGQANVIVGGVAGNILTHTVSCYIRGGTGRLDVHVGTGPSVTFGASASYVRRTDTAAISDVNAALRVYADPGQVLYFILNQFEQYGAATTPIIVAGASAQRQTENVTFPWAQAAPVTLFSDYYPLDILSTTSHAVINLGTNATSNRHLIYTSTTALLGDTVSNSVGQVNVSSGNSIARNRAAYAFDTNNARACSNGTLSAADTSCAAPVTMTTGRLGLQGDAASSPFNGFIHQAAVYPSRLTDAQLQALTTL